MQSKVPLVMALAMFAFALIAGIMYVSSSNAEVRLRNQVVAQQKSNEAVFDNTWKILQSQAGVAQTERESFRATYSQIMQDTRGVAGSGALASFFTQAKIDISPELFGKLMTSIEAQRTAFTREQQELIDLKREHDTLLQTLPSSIFVGDRPPIEIIVVTSAKTEAAFGSGQENDVELFNLKSGGTQ